MSIVEEPAPPAGGAAPPDATASDGAPGGVAAPPPLRRNRNFLLLWAGAAGTLVGARVTSIAYPMLVLWYTGSAGNAGLVGAAALLPHLLVQLPAGAFVDRWDRRRLMIFCDLGCLVATGSVALAVLLDRVWVPQLMVVAFVQTSLSVFYQLGERAAVRHLVPAEQLPTALTQNETRGRAAVLIGQPVGGVLFTVAKWAPFLFTTIAHLGSLVALLLIRKPFQQARPERRGTTLRADIAEGVAWLWRQRFLRTVLGFVAISNAVFQALTLALMVIVRNGGGSAAVVGAVIGASGVGGMLGALTGMWWLRRATLRALVVGGLAAWAVTVPLMAFTTDPVSLAMIFAANSYVGGLFNVVGMVYLVRITPDPLMGRVGAVATLLASGSNFLGALAGGVLLAGAGIRATVLGLAAVMSSLVVLAVLSPAVRGIARTPENARMVRRLGRHAAPGRNDSVRTARSDITRTTDGPTGNVGPDPAVSAVQRPHGRSREKV
ncbi:MFS transporter [Plantactinospora endophytica]|uniref:MFS transporter n=1 Tax=Plantactinospora endophytica TaxID=673535 RepID=A0ABQ4E0R7_9ACTN|nr:MFS transporter [Plantactinospora endophytica]GIG88298.1 MFS transporter [Plantactinospora endophytica]